MKESSSCSKTSRTELRIIHSDWKKDWDSAVPTQICKLIYAVSDQRRGRVKGLSLSLVLPKLPLSELGCFGVGSR